MASLLALLLVLTSFTESGPSLFGVNLFDDTGHHSRPEIFEDPDIRSVGWLYGGGFKCVATLVDANVIVTAAHCLKNPDGKTKDYRWQFITGADILTHGTTADIDINTIVAMTKNWEENAHRDVAFARLTRPLDPSKFKALKVESYLDFQPTVRDVPVMITLYDHLQGDKPTTERCKTYNFHTNHYYYHDCSTSEGSSAAPLYLYEHGPPVVVGLNTGADYSDVQGFIISMNILRITRLTAASLRWLWNAFKPARLHQTRFELPKGHV